MSEQVARITRNFTEHAVKGEQRKHMVRIREAALALAMLIHDSTPSSREQSLALTKLEEVTFWANASIARQEGM